MPQWAILASLIQDIAQFFEKKPFHWAFGSKGKAEIGQSLNDNYWFLEKNWTKRRRGKCAVNMRWRRLLKKVLRDRLADITIKFSYTKPPRSNIYMTQCHFSYIFPMIADIATGYFSDSHRSTKPTLSGLQGTWRAIKQADIFLVNHQQRGNFWEHN